jgi:hypothetical protein
LIKDNFENGFRWQKHNVPWITVFEELTLATRKS